MVEIIIQYVIEHGKTAWTHSYMALELKFIVASSYITKYSTQYYTCIALVF